MPSAAHDRVVLTRSLSSAIAEASRRQRARVVGMRSPAPSVVSSWRRPNKVEPPSPSARVETPNARVMQNAIRAQQRDALVTRSRAREMLTAAEEMRARTRELRLRVDALAARGSQDSEPAAG